MNLIGVCISAQSYDVKFPVPLYFHTQGYKDIRGHNNLNRERLEYLTGRYNAAIERAISDYPRTDHLLVVDSYYLSFAAEVLQLIEDYKEGTMTGGSIWYWDRSHVHPVIRYYDTLSVKEFRGRTWRSQASLPRGTISVSGVGGCWILPRKTWEASSGFTIPKEEPQAGSSKCLGNSNVEVRLNCNVRLWRTHADNPDIPEYSWAKRFRVSLGEYRRHFQARLRAGN